MRVGFALQATVPCAACHAPVAVPGLVESCPCGKCGARSLLPPHLWRSLFGELAFAEAAACAEGDAVTVTDTEGGSTVVYGRRQPRCHRCKLELPVDSLDRLARVGHHDCVCGGRIRVREADALARSLLPAARFVVRESTPDAPGPAAPPFILVAELSEGELARMVALGGEDGAALAAADPAASADTLGALAQSQDWTARAGVARNPSTPAEVLSSLADDEDSDVVEALALNPALPPPLCERLCGHDDADVRSKAVVHPRTSLAAIRQLVERGESDGDVLKAIATRADVDTALLDKLRIEGDTDVLAVIALHPSADEAMLLALAHRNDSDVGRALLRRKTLPLSVLRALTAEDAMVTEERVRAHPSYPLLAAFHRRVNVAIGIGVLVVVVFLAAVAVFFPAAE